MLLRRHSLFLSTGQTHAFLFVFFIKKSKLKCTHKLQFNFSLSAKLDFRESISLAPFFCLVCVCVCVFPFSSFFFYLTPTHLSFKLIAPILTTMKHVPSISSTSSEKLKASTI